MGCLIEIKFTKDASEKNPIIIIVDYRRFFRGCKIVSEKQDGDKKILEIYVRHSENVVSRFMVDWLSKDKRVEKAKLVS